jgi:hypothetical protein
VAFELGRYLFSDSRRAVRVVEPSVQLRLLLTLVALTAVFVAAFVWNSHAAYERLVELGLAHAQEAFRSTVAEQTGDFLIVSWVILGAYLLAVAGVCLACTHRLIGPRVALLRQIEALKRGEYGARITLRQGDRVFSEVARDLNELAQILERAAKAERRTRATQPLSAAVR